MSKPSKRPSGSRPRVIPLSVDLTDRQVRGKYGIAGAISARADYAPSELLDEQDGYDSDIERNDDT
jgi:hypothetical protein